MSERGPFYVAVILPPDRSKYRFPPYWWPDDPIPELAPETSESATKERGDG